MKAEHAKKIADEALANLTAALDQGKSESLTAYLTMLGRFHHYSFNNVMLIAMQKPDATQVAGFNAWRKLNRFVRKGEKGIVIIAPMHIKAKAEADDDEENDRDLLRFRAVYVFDVSQTDGDPLPEFAGVAGDPGAHTERLIALISASGITLDYADNLGGALGRSLGGRIEVLKSLSPAEEFSVLTHELAHELMHRGDRRSATTKTVRETEAEAVAFVVSRAIGLECGSHAADYIQLYDGKRETLVESLDLIQKTAARVIEAILGEPATE